MCINLIKKLIYFRQNLLGPPDDLPLEDVTYELDPITNEVTIVNHRIDDNDVD